MSIHEIKTAPKPAAAPRAMRPIPVRGDGQDLSGGHQGINVSYLISSAENPVVQLLGRDYDRLEARVLASCPSGTPNGGQSYSGNGDVASPVGSGTTIAAANGGAALPAGNYVISGTMMFAGTATNADFQNLGLYVGSTLIAALQGVANTAQVAYIQAITVTVPAGGAIVALKSIGAGSGTATYMATFSATPVAGSAAPGGIVLAQSKEMAEWAAAAGAAFAGPIGSYLPLGVDRTMRHCDEVWAAALSSTPVLVSAIVSRRLASEPPAGP
jgi:hypothetical protein